MSIRALVNAGAGKVRGGRGFSRGEFEKAGWSPEAGLTAGVTYDPRRKSTHEHNVVRLQELRESAAQS